MTLPFGIDISKHQGVNDYAKMKANTAFVFVKATESWGYVDPKFVSNWQGLAGHNRGAYCYVYLSEEPLRQANHLIDTVTKAGADWRYDRLVLDLEKSGHGLSKAEVARRVLIMMERIKEVTGRYPILYSRASWINDNMLVTDPRLVNADWWLAHYLQRKPFPLYTPERNSPPSLPRGVNKWLIHQASERGNGSAVGVGSYYVDCNRWNGTQEQVAAYFGRGEDTPPEPEPEPDPGKLFDAKVYSWATPYINFRSEPRVAKETDIDDIGIETILPVYEIVEDWYKAKYKNTYGFVMSKYLQPLNYEPPSVLIDIPPLSQRDPRWANIRLGNSYLTLGSDGCLATDFAMVIGVNPDEFNARLKAVGGFTGANIYWQMIDDAYPNCEYVWAYDCYYIPAPLNEIDKLLQRGISVMVHTLKNGYQHWVLIVGKNGDDYIINDPWDGVRCSFRERYGDPARWIYRIRAYRMAA